MKKTTFLIFLISIFSAQTAHADFYTLSNRIKGSAPTASYFHLNYANGHITPSNLQKLEGPFRLVRREGRFFRGLSRRIPLVASLSMAASLVFVTSRDQKTGQKNPHHYAQSNDFKAGSLN